MCTPMLITMHQAGLTQYLGCGAGRCQYSGQLAQRREAKLCSRAAKTFENLSWLPHGASGCRGWACSRRAQASAGTPLVPGACASEQPPSVLRRINSSTKWAVSTAAAALLLLRHDSATLWCLAGSVASTALCKVAAVGRAAHCMQPQASQSVMRVMSLSFSQPTADPVLGMHLFQIKALLAHIERHETCQRRAVLYIERHETCQRRAVLYIVAPLCQASSLPSPSRSG